MAPRMIEPADQRDGGDETIDVTRPVTPEFIPVPAFDHGEDQPGGEQQPERDDGDADDAGNIERLVRYRRGRARGNEFLNMAHRLTSDLRDQRSMKPMPMDESSARMR